MFQLDREEWLQVIEAIENQISRYDGIIGRGYKHKETMNLYTRKKKALAMDIYSKVIQHIAVE